MDTLPPAMQRPALLEFASALGSRRDALRRDACGDWTISGKHGHVYAYAPGRFQVMAGAHSARAWMAVKAALDFANQWNRQHIETFSLFGWGKESQMTSLPDRDTRYDDLNSASGSSNKLMWIGGALVAVLFVGMFFLSSSGHIPANTASDKVVIQDMTQPKTTSPAQPSPPPKP